LANLYINDFYGEDNRAAAIPLLRQAGELGHADALLYLGYLHNAGREVKQSPEIAADYFAQAAALNNTQAIINYGRFIATEAAGEHLTDANRAQAITWLENLTDNPEAMVVLGNLHAKGIGTRTSTSRAVRWYKKAVKVDPVDADIVNEVAWTLTVTDVQGLKRAKYAKQIMDHMMDNNEQAKARPEYLDTWAAAHAASGDFAEAIRLQEQAIAIATATDRADVIEILKGHLNLFKSGATITEQAP
jgi:TPR repeat protein